LQEAIAGANAEEKIKSPNKKGSRHFPRGKADTGRTQTTRNSSALNVKKQDTTDAIAAPAVTLINSVY